MWIVACVVVKCILIFSVLLTRFLNLEMPPFFAQS